MLGQFNGSQVAIYDPDLDLWTFTSREGRLVLGGDVHADAGQQRRHRAVLERQEHREVPPRHRPVGQRRRDPEHAARRPARVSSPRSGQRSCCPAASCSRSARPATPRSTTRPSRVASAWTAGPTLKDRSNNTSFPMDAPGVLLPNGKVLLVGSPAPAVQLPGTEHVLRVQPHHQHRAPWSSSPTDASGRGVHDALPAAADRRGAVLRQHRQRCRIYKPSGSPKAAWKPTITDAPDGHGHRAHVRALRARSSTGCRRHAATATTRRWRRTIPLVRIDQHRDEQGALPAHVAPLDDGRGHRQHDRRPRTSPCPTDIAGRAVLAGGRGQRHRVRPGYRRRGQARRASSIIDRSTFGQGEIQAMINNAGAPATIDPAVYVVVEGYKPSELGHDRREPGQPAAQAVDPEPGRRAVVRVQRAGRARRIRRCPNSPQRFTFPMRAKFAGTSMFTLRGVDEDRCRSTRRMTASGTTVDATGAIELIKNPNPFILHGDIAHGYPWYLSVDMRVFQLKAGQTRFAAHVASSGDPHDAALNFIQQAITQPQRQPGIGRRRVRRAAAGRGPVRTRAVAGRYERHAGLQLRRRAGALPRHDPGAATCGCSSGCGRPSRPTPSSTPRTNTAR